MPVADLKAGISQATYFNWKKRYDGLLPTEMRRLKQLEDENGKLKKLVAELSLDREMLIRAIDVTLGRYYLARQVRWYPGTLESWPQRWSMQIPTRLKR